jgi:anthranilate phosphoribosyltransferase
MAIKEVLNKLVARIDLSTEEMQNVMREVMTGGATQSQIGAFLAALRMKGETLDEIAGAAMVMRELATPVSVNAKYLVDTCGTGGDGANLFNVSSASAFVAAAAGAQVAKHGGRSVSSSTGSADLLEAAGINLDITAEQVARCVEEIGVGFMYAPAHHSAMKYAGGARKELGMRTIFNMLGPITNPANVKRQVIGVFNGELCRPMAEVLARLGSEHVMVVHAKDGLDEISLATETQVAELKNGEIREYFIKPEDFGMQSKSLIGLSVSNAEDSLLLIRDALGNRRGQYAEKAADIIALNAGAAIYVSGVALSLADGVEMARDAIGSSLAGEKIRELAAFTNYMK